MIDTLDSTTVVLNILNFYAGATPAEKKQGHLWYPNARAHAEARARKHGMSTQQVAAVIAVLSPQMEWKYNLRWADEVIGAHLKGKPLPIRGLGNNVRRAAIALSGDFSDVERTTGTLKVHNFYASIIGRRGAVCIDRHAIRIALGDELGNRISITDKQYRFVAECYMDAAREFKMRASHMQAITWLVCKRKREGASELESRASL